MNNSYLHHQMAKHYEIELDKCSSLPVKLYKGKLPTGVSAEKNKQIREETEARRHMLCTLKRGQQMENGDSPELERHVKKLPKGFHHIKPQPFKTDEDKRAFQRKYGC